MKSELDLSVVLWSSVEAVCISFRVVERGHKKPLASPASVGFLCFTREENEMKRKFLLISGRNEITSYEQNRLSFFFSQRRWQIFKKMCTKGKRKEVSSPLYSSFFLMLPPNHSFHLQVEVLFRPLINQKRRAETRERETKPIFQLSLAVFFWLLNHMDDDDDDDYVGLEYTFALFFNFPPFFRDVRAECRQRSLISANGKENWNETENQKLSFFLYLTSTHEHEPQCCVSVERVELFMKNVWWSLCMRGKKGVNLVPQNTYRSCTLHLNCQLEKVCGSLVSLAAAAAAALVEVVIMLPSKYPYEKLRIWKGICDDLRERREAWPRRAKRITPRPKD